MIYLYVPVWTVWAAPAAMLISLAITLGVCLFHEAECRAAYRDGRRFEAARIRATRPLWSLTPDQRATAYRSDPGPEEWPTLERTITR